MSQTRTLTCGGCGGEEFNIRYELKAEPGEVELWAECAECGRRTRALDNPPGARKK